MVELLYNNYASKVFKSCDISNVSAVAEKSNTYQNVTVQPIRVRAYTVKLHGVERALCRCGKSQEMKYRIVAAIMQQQDDLRVRC